MKKLNWEVRTYDLTNNVTNLPDLPEGTIDTNTLGNYEDVIEVVYPDGTKDTIKAHKQMN